MGSWINFYKVLEAPTFDIEKVQNEFLSSSDFMSILKGEFGTPLDSIDRNFPYYLFYHDCKNPIDGTNCRTFNDEAWFVFTETSPSLEMLEGNDLFTEFKDRAFHVPCAEYLNGEWVRTNPLFLEIKSCSCPCARLYPADSLFVKKEKFIQHLRDYSEDFLCPETKLELIDFFEANFIDSENIVYLF